MIKFEDYKYVRPNMQEEKQTFAALLDQLKGAASLEDAVQAIDAINKQRSRLSTMGNLAHIRATIDTNDEFYQQERDFFDVTIPEIQEMITAFYRQLLASPFRSQLEERYGAQLFKIAEYEIKAFSPEVMELLQKENKLTSEYAKLKASAQIEFQGSVYTLAQMEPFEEHPDRQVRRQAVEAKFGFFAKHREAFDRIYDELVKTRHEIAVRLGYKNFIELGYIRMKRIDYDAEMVARFRRQVRETIVPLANKLYQRQPRESGLSI